MSAQADIQPKATERRIHSLAFLFNPFVQQMLDDLRPAHVGEGEVVTQAVSQLSWGRKISDWFGSGGGET